MLGEVRREGGVLKALAAEERTVEQLQEDQVPY